MTYELVPLGELGEIVTGSTPDTTNKDYWDGDIPWITPANLTNHEGVYFTGELRKITEAGYKSCSTKMLPAGSIVYSTRAPIGHCAVTSFPLCTNQGFKSIIPNKKLDAVYGFFALKFFTPQIEALGRGATFAEVNKETFENFRIPLPPLTEQKRIASLLARADRLRQLRRTAHDLGDALLQSVFLKMFGEPDKNPRKWKKQPLTELTRFPITYGILKPGEYVPDGVIMLRIQDIQNGRIRKHGLHRVSNELSKQYRRTILNGDEIVMSLVGTLGLVALIDSSLKGANLHRNLGVIAPKSNINTLFLYSYLSLPQTRDLIMQVTKGGNQGLLNLEDLRNVEIPVPPLSLQEEFAGVVARVESLRGRMSEGERQVEGLFESLLAEAFS